MTNRTCTRDGCEKPYRARGLCATHYNQTLPNRHTKVEVPCTHCGQVVTKHPSKRYRPFCDLACRDLYLMEHKQGAWGRTPTPKPVKPKVDLRSPLRRAYEAGDHAAATITAIRDHCDVRPNGCWEWGRKIHASGYAVVAIAGKTMQVHRLSLEARLGRKLGKQAAHHVCANSFCVNPDHLQPVTHAANTAEMLARTYMVQRITELEEALRLFNPKHSLLAEISVQRVA